MMVFLLIYAIYTSSPRQRLRKADAKIKIFYKYAKCQQVNHEKDILADKMIVLKLLFFRENYKYSVLKLVFCRLLCIFAHSMGKTCVI